MNAILKGVCLFIVCFGVYCFEILNDNLIIFSVYGMDEMLVLMATNLWSSMWAFVKNYITQENPSIELWPNS